MPRSEPESHPTSRRFGEFELLERIARGGMGTVFRARQRSPERIVALKLLTGVDPKQESYRRFQREAAAIARLHHPHVVKLHEVGEVDGTPYFTMDLIEGRDLAACLLEGDLDRRALVKILAVVAETVAEAHREGILHRDLKPANILLDRSGHPYVTDFGLARDLTRVDSLTVDGEAVGTPAYMAPEQARGIAIEEPQRSDVYSLGAVLYELLAGRPPFEGATSFEVLQKVASDDPTPPRRLDPSIDRDLETICLKCLAKDPRARYASARELADDLRRTLAGEPIVARPLSTISRIVRKARRHRARTAAIAVASVSAATIAVIAGLARMETQREKEKALAVESRAAVERLFASLQDDLAMHREANAELKAREMEAEARDRGDVAGKLAAIADALRAQLALSAADAVAARAERIAAEEARPDLVARTLETRARTLAALHDFEGARRALDATASVPHTRALRDWLAVIGTGTVALDLDGHGGRAGVVPWVRAANLDDDPRAEVIARADVRSEWWLVWRNGAPCGVPIRFPRPEGEYLPAPQVELEDANGDGRGDALLLWTGTGPDGSPLPSKLEIRELAIGDAEVSAGPARFAAEFVDGNPSTFLGEVDGKPGRDLVARCAPYSRALRMYPGSGEHGFPDDRRGFDLDPQLPESDTDVSALAAVWCESTHRPYLVVGTGHHAGHDVRMYEVSDGAARRVGSPLAAGWVSGLATAARGGASGDELLAFVSETPKDPLFVNRLKDPVLARVPGVVAFRCTPLGPVAVPDAVGAGVPGRELTESPSETDYSVSSCTPMRTGRDSARATHFEAGSLPRLGAHWTYGVKRFGVLWREGEEGATRSEAVSISTAGAAMPADLDGDGDDELVMSVPGGVEIAGLHRSTALVATRAEAALPEGLLLDRDRDLNAIWSALCADERPREDCLQRIERDRVRRLLAIGAIDGSEPMVRRAFPTLEIDAAFAAARFAEVAEIFERDRSRIGAALSLWGDVPPSRLESVARFFARSALDGPQLELGWPEFAALAGDLRTCAGTTRWERSLARFTAKGWEGPCLRATFGGKFGEIEPPSTELARCEDLPMRMTVDFMIDPMSYATQAEVGLFERGGREMVHGVLVAHLRSVRRPIRNHRRIELHAPGLLVISDPAVSFETGMWHRATISAFPEGGVAFVELRNRERGPDAAPLAVGITLDRCAFRGPLRAGVRGTNLEGAGTCTLEVAGIRVETLEE